MLRGERAARSCFQITASPPNTVFYKQCSLKLLFWQHLSRLFPLPSQSPVSPVQSRSLSAWPPFAALSPIRSACRARRRWALQSTLELKQVSKSHLMTLFSSFVTTRCLLCLNSSQVGWENGCSRFARTSTRSTQQHPSFNMFL